MRLQSNDSKFRILIIADIQAWKPLNAQKQACLVKLLNVSEPDLVVLLGDMLCGYVMFAKRRICAVLHSILAPIWEKNLPYVFISGNHDQDAHLSLEEQIQIYREGSRCLTPLPSERDCYGAFVLQAEGVENKPIGKLLFLDGGKTKLTFHGIQYLPPDEAQLAFSEQELNGENQMPVFIFQHVPIPDIYQLIQIKDHFSPGAVRGHGPYHGRFLTLKEEENGVLGEAPCPSWYNTSQLAGWVQSRRTIAAVFGHDHKNSFVGKVDGISLIQVSCAGLSCYGTDALRGGQLLTLYPGGRFETKALYYRDIL